MKSIGDYIIYRRDVCKIIDYKKINNNDYYVLEPVNDNSLHITIPIDNVYIKELMNITELEELINNIPNIDIIEENDRNIENKYKELLDSGIHENLIRIIKTTYIRNKNRVDNKKKISERDKHYFDLAEHYLYSEIGILLNKNFEDTKKYIVDILEKLK